MTDNSNTERNFTVGEDDDGIRLDRWFKRHLTDISFNQVSRWERTGQLRIDGKRAAPGDRLEIGQVLRIPPADATPAREPRAKRQIVPLNDEEAEMIREMVIHEDADAYVLDKPPGLATQGDQHLSASRPPARWAGRRSGPKAEAGPPARQGHQRGRSGRTFRPGCRAFFKGVRRTDPRGKSIGR